MTNEAQRESFGSAWTGGQWSFVRVVYGAAFLGGTIALAVSSAGVPSRRAFKPFDLQLVVQVVAAILILVGTWTRFAALLLLGFQVTLAIASDFFVDPSFELAVALPLVLLALAPQAPFGSFEARGRVDPAGGWRLPPWLFGLAWVATALTGIFVSFAILSTMKRSDSSTDPFAALVTMVFAGFAFAALAPFAKTRRFAWIALCVGQIAAGVVERRLDFLAIRLALPLFLLDPAWLAPRRAPASEFVFFDGHCGLCHRLVRFVLGEDRAKLFVFSTLQGEKIQTLLDGATRAQLPDSVVVRDFTGRLLLKSAAVVHVYDRLGGIWRVVSHLLRVIPTPLRDVGYDFVAAIRHRVFARPADSCPLMPPALKDRFVA